MFQKSRRKIVASIMAILALLWIGTLCVIYFASYYEVHKTNQEMLQEHAQHYMLNNPSLNDFPPLKPFPDKGPHMDTPQFKASNFYSVAMSETYDILEINKDKSTTYTDDELIQISKDVLQKNKTSGIYQQLSYYISQKEGYLLVTFMDHTIQKENIKTLIKQTIFYGCIMMMVLYFISLYLAKKIVQPLEENDQRQKQFISDAGHELKTPISIISANAELLERELKDNPWLHNIQYENTRMSQLIQQLLTLARNEHANIPMDKINFSHLLEGDILPFESIAYEHGLSIHTNIQRDLYVLGNQNQLSQLISILIDNAIQHNKHGTQIHITLQANKHDIIFTIQNMSDSLSKEQLNQLFERFYRIDEARNSESNHYGLGCAIAKTIVEQHHGKIKAQYQAPYITFIIQIPKY